MNIKIKHPTRQTPAKAQRINKKLRTVLDAASATLTHPLVIEFVDYINIRRRHCYWYGGDVVRLHYNGWKFDISAIGDVCFTLYRASDGDELVDVRDKRNLGELGYELLPYIKTDVSLEKLLLGDHPTYDYEQNHNNWWEISATDPNGKWHDLMWSADSDDLFEAIAEAVTELDNTINRLSE